MGISVLDYKTYYKRVGPNNYTKQYVRRQFHVTGRSNKRLLLEQEVSTGTLKTALVVPRTNPLKMINGDLWIRVGPKDRAI